MKRLWLSIIIMTCILSCSDNSTQPDNIQNKIIEVESNLIPPIFIQGDSTWTIEERMKHYGVPGVSLAVIHNGEIAWTKTYGTTDKENNIPVTDKTLFQAASISKPVSAYAALRLVQEGKIDLTLNINDQLKSWKLEENEFTKEKAVTLKNLINHSAGITVHGFLGYSPGLDVPTLHQVLDGLPPANSAAMQVDKTPEESFRYSGGGYNIVQQLMIDTEQKTFPEILKDLVLDPLDMSNSSFNQPLNDEQLKYAATGYLPNGEMTQGRRHTYPEMAAAGLWTTAEDLAKFAINIQKTIKGDSSLALSKEMTELMLTPFVEDNVGLGIFLINKGDDIYFGHGGWNEGFSSELMAHKDKGYGVAIMINSNHPDFISELMRSVALTYEWDDFVKEYKSIDNKGSQNAHIIGKYKVRGFDYIEIAEGENNLLLKDGPEEEFIDLIQVTDSTFAVRQFDALFQFKKDEESDSVFMHILDSNALTTDVIYNKMINGEKLPLEHIVNGDYEEALKKYLSIKAEAPEDPNVSENNLNDLGYRFLNQGQHQLAKDLFMVNIKLYPDSYNVYDSYAEACMEAGENDLAIEYYKKSLELNPENNNATFFIEQLMEKK